VHLASSATHCNGHGAANSLCICNCSQTTLFGQKCLEKLFFPKNINNYSLKSGLAQESEKILAKCIRQHFFKTFFDSTVGTFSPLKNYTKFHPNFT